MAPGRRVSDLPAQLRRRERRRDRRSRGHHLARGLSRLTRSRRRVVEPVLSLGAGRRRVRRRRLPRYRPAHRDARTVRPPRRRAAPRATSRSSSTSCRITAPTATSGSERRSPPDPVHPNATATSSATAPDPNGDEPPADWTSFFGGPAWTQVPDGQWYLHLFTREQPDWNWNNDDVRARLPRRR